MSTCTVCGGAVRAGAQFCTACGTMVVQASAPAAVVAASAPSSAAAPVAARATGRSFGPALLLHMVYPGAGLLYAEAAALGTAMILVTTVGLGWGTVALWRGFRAALQQQSALAELGFALLVFLGVLLLWGAGIGMTKRAVAAYNAGRTAHGGRVLLLIIWELLTLVAVTGLLLVR